MIMAYGLGPILGRGHVRLTQLCNSGTGLPRADDYVYKEMFLLCQRETVWMQL